MNRGSVKVLFQPELARIQREGERLEVVFKSQVTHIILLFPLSQYTHTHTD